MFATVLHCRRWKKSDIGQNCSSRMLLIPHRKVNFSEFFLHSTGYFFPVKSRYWMFWIGIGVVGTGPVAAEAGLGCWLNYIQLKLKQFFCSNSAQSCCIMKPRSVLDSSADFLLKNRQNRQDWLATSQIKFD